MLLQGFFYVTLRIPPVWMYIVCKCQTAYSRQILSYSSIPSHIYKCKHCLKCTHNLRQFYTFFECIAASDTKIKYWEFDTCINPKYFFFFVGRKNSSVGIASRYGLGYLGIESRWWRHFSHPSRLPWGEISPLCNVNPSTLLGVKTASALCWPPTPI